MALFNNEGYDRNYGYRGTNRAGGYGGGYGAYDRDMGDRSGGTWNSMKRNTREFFGMDNRYDRNYNTSGYNRGTTGYTGYSRTPTGSGYGAVGTTGYDRTYGYRGTTAGYDRGYTAGYDNNYKSRAQTDAGDPFGDRQSNTPIRVLEERDEGWFNWGSDRDYDRNYRYGRDYGANPVGYDPYDNRGGNTYRTGGMNRGYDRTYRGTNRGYDRGWF